MAFALQANHDLAKQQAENPPAVCPCEPFSVLFGQNRGARVFDQPGREGAYFVVEHAADVAERSDKELAL